MNNSSTDIGHLIIMIIVIAIVGLIIMGAMGKFDNFGSRITKRFRIKKRGRIYTDKIVSEKPVINDKL